MVETQKTEQEGNRKRKGWFHIPKSAKLSFTLIITGIVIGVLLAIVIPRKIGGLLQSKGGETTGEAVIEQISHVQKLITMEYNYKDVGTHDDTRKILGSITNPLTSKKMIFTFKGTIKTGVDVSKIRVNVDEDAKVVYITLPKGEILSHEMPPEEIKTYDERTGVFSKYTFDDRNQILNGEKIRIEKEFIEGHYLEDSQKDAEAAIRILLSGLTDKEGYILQFQYEEDVEENVSREISGDTEEMEKQEESV